MNRLKSAIIGLGHQAIEDHIPGIKDSRFARLEAICDTNEKKLKEWQRKMNVPGFTDYKEMFDKIELDFIIATTPHDAYKEIIEEASKRHLHILKEKPFARSLKEAFYFEKLCRENGIKLMTTLQRRFNPIYRTFFQLKEQIGNLFFIEAKYTFFVDNPRGGWRGNRCRAGGGCIIDMGYHMIDMIIWFFGLPDNVHAEFLVKAKSEEQYGVEDTAFILFSYDSGLNGMLMLSRYCPPKIEQIKVIGDRGIIEVERGIIKRLRNNGEEVESLTRVRSWPAAATDQVDYFCGVIKGEKENMGSPRYHLQHVSFIEACYKSQQEKKYINPKELLIEYGEHLSH